MFFWEGRGVHNKRNCGIKMFQPSPHRKWYLNRRVWGGKSSQSLHNNKHNNMIEFVPFLYAHDSKRLVVARATPKGWRVRSTEPGMQRDYVSNETREQLKEWFRLDGLGHLKLSPDRVGASKCLTPSHPATFHWPGASVERVLQHLESGW